MAELIDKFERMYTDMYIGHGGDRSSMTTRMAVLEEKHASICDRLDKIEKGQLWAQRFAIATLLGLIGDIIIHAILK